MMRGRLRRRRLRRQAAGGQRVRLVVPPVQRRSAPDLATFAEQNPDARWSASPRGHREGRHGVHAREYGLRTAMRAGRRQPGAGVRRHRLPDDVLLRRPRQGSGPPRRSRDPRRSSTRRWPSPSDARRRVRRSEHGHDSRRDHLSEPHGARPRVRRRPALVRLAVRPPAAARVPLVRLRGRASRSWGGSTGDCCWPPCCSSPGSPPSSWCSGPAPAASAGCSSQYRDVLMVVAGAFIAFSGLVVAGVVRLPEPRRRTSRPIAPAPAARSSPAPPSPSAGRPASGTSWARSSAWPPPAQSAVSGSLLLLVYSSRPRRAVRARRPRRSTGSARGSPGSSATTSVVQVTAGVLLVVVGVLLMFGVLPTSQVASRLQPGRALTLPAVPSPGRRRRRRSLYPWRDEPSPHPEAHAGRA